MQKLLIKNGSRYRAATPAEVAEVAGHYARAAFNKARPVFDSPAATAAALTEIYSGRDYETFGVLFLDNRHRLIEMRELFRGTIDGASVHPREVVKEVLWQGAAAVVFAHNHPSGIAEPSQADEVITARLVQALALIEVRVLDHIVIGAGGRYVSFAERGLV